MTLYVARHAHAGRRAAWTDDDQFRPLSEKGRRQADGIAAALRPSVVAPTRILSSPATRCVQTVEPLASALETTVTVDDRLREGVGRSEVAALLDDLAAAAAEGTVVCSSHGDVIPQLLRTLVDRGMRPDRSLLWQKASVWAIERTADGWGPGRYAPPPPV